MPPEVQGPVFGVMRRMAEALFPLWMALPSPLAFFEPAMVPGHMLARSGAGMSLVLILAGLLGVLTGLMLCGSSCLGSTRVIPGAGSLAAGPCEEARPPSAASPGSNTR
jgi:hypothetical protein